MTDRDGIGYCVRLSLPDLEHVGDVWSAHEKILVQFDDAENDAILNKIIKYAAKRGYNKAFVLNERRVREMFLKQIPQEPLVLLGTDILVCRFCKSELAKYDGRHTYPHCQWCGQKIKNMEDENNDTST